MRALRVPGAVSNRVSGERRSTRRDKVRSSSASSPEQLLPLLFFYEFNLRGETPSPAQRSPDAPRKIPWVSKLLHSPLPHPINVNHAAPSCRKQLCPQQQLNEAHCVFMRYKLLLVFFFYNRLFWDVIFILFHVWTVASVSLGRSPGWCCVMRIYQLVSATVQSRKGYENNISKQSCVCD